MPDIQFVGQWRATCSLATLWQRFGRAVRDMSLVGAAVLFCEPEYFDQYRKEKETKKSQGTGTAKKKWKATATLAIASTKRRCGEGKRSCSDEHSNMLMAQTEAVAADELAEQDSASSDDEATALRGSQLATARAGIRAGSAPGPGGLGMDGWEKKRANKQGFVLQPAMDWFINADERPGAGCRRDVVNVFFENEAAGERLSISGCRATAQSTNRVRSPLVQHFI